MDRGHEYGAIYLPGAADAATTAVTRVTHQQAVDPKSRAGLMMRDDIAAAGTSPGYVVVGIRSGNDFVMNWDADGHGNLDTTRVAGTTAYPPGCG